VLGESHDPRASSRQALLHDGDGGEQIVSAYVEITLDNSDERLPVESNEVTIRRQVGAKKDEYFVNMKKSQKVRSPAAFLSLHPCFCLTRAEAPLLPPTPFSLALSLFSNE